MLFLGSFFTSELACGRSLEFEWLQVFYVSWTFLRILFFYQSGLWLESEWLQIFSCLLDLSQNSVLSQQWCNMNGLDSFSGFLLYQSSFLWSMDFSKHTNFSWYHFHCYAPVFLQGHSICRSFQFFKFLFSFCGPLEQQNPLKDKFSLFCLSTLVLFVWLG